MRKFVNLTIVNTVLIACLSFQAIGQDKAVPKKSVQPTVKPKPAASTTSGGFKKLPGGVEYKIVKDVPGKNAVYGDFLSLHILMKADTMMIRSSRKENQNVPFKIQYNPSTAKGDFSSAFGFLSTGDSAIIRVSMDTVMAANPGQKFPDFFKKGKKIIYEISVASVMSKEENQKEVDAQNKAMQEMAKGQISADDKLLQDYFKTNNINAQKTASGLYYVIQKEGEGSNITKGQKASVNYTGKLINGKMFDSNTDPAKGHVSPFEFKVGMGQVIPGWDEGVALLKKGSKATLYIPSQLGYGARGAGGDIPPNSVLIFDIEVLDVKAE